jgi:putative tricarboxylic transport membrane protein
VNLPSTNPLAGGAFNWSILLRIDRTIFVCTLCIAAAYFYGITQIPSLEIGDPLGPRVFPYLIGAGLLVSAAWLLMEIIQAEKAAQPEAEPAPEAEPGDHRHLVLIAAVVVWMALYFAVFEWLGFLLATPIFLLVLMAYLNRGKWLANVSTVLVFTVGTYALFSKVLGVSLAKGLLGI